MILAGDIGGTKTLLALFEVQGDRLQRTFERRYASADYQSFDALLEAFLDEAGGRPEVLCVGVAGPVLEGRCAATNLPWVLDEAALAEHTGIARVHLLNDVEAAALGALELETGRLVALNPDARRRRGNRAMLAPGTGLGEAVLHWSDGGYRPMATEGGHADFAPRDALEDGLLVYLRDALDGHVSVEHVLSGPGIRRIYNYLAEVGDLAEPARTAERIREAQDPSAVIGELALAGESPRCRRTLEVFIGLLAAEAGNLALRSLAVGGVLIGGGIAPRILPLIGSPRFMAGFSAKGRFHDLLRAMPVEVVTDPAAPLLGAAARGRQLLAGP